MMTGDQYRESLRKLELEICCQGERIVNPVDHPEPERRTAGSK